MKLLITVPAGILFFAAFWLASCYFIPWFRPTGNSSTDGLKPLLLVLGPTWIGCLGMFRIVPQRWVKSMFVVITATVAVWLILGAPVHPSLDLYRADHVR